jgi:hypothetical protein
MTRVKVLASIAIIFVIGAAFVAMLRGPLYARYSAAECLDAYERAPNRTDSAHVDLHPYAPANRSTRNHRCGEVRAVRADSGGDIVSR